MIYKLFPIIFFTTFAINIYAANYCSLLVEEYQAAVQQHRESLDQLAKTVFPGDIEEFKRLIEAYFTAEAPYSNTILFLKNAVLSEYIYQHNLNSTIENNDLGIIGGGLRGGIIISSYQLNSNIYEQQRFGFSTFLRAYFETVELPYSNQFL